MARELLSRAIALMAIPPRSPPPAPRDPMKPTMHSLLRSLMSIRARPRRRATTLLVACCVAAMSMTVAAQGVRDVLGPPLREALAAARAAGSAAPSDTLAAAHGSTRELPQVPVYLVMADQLDAGRVTETLGGVQQRARRGAVITRLRQHAATTQAAVRATLAAAQAAGRASDVRELWIGNALVFSAQPDVIEALAGMPGVDRIRLDLDPDPSQVQDAVATPLAPIAPAAVSGTAPYPFADNFESGSLQPWWTVATTGSGYATVSTANAPVNTWHVLMATSVDGVDSTASLTLCLDLLGETDVGIRFQHKSFSDDADAQDGVFVSTDGINWQLALSLTGGTSTYSPKTINLDLVAASLGLSYTSTFFVRFQWKDNFNIPSDGFGFDNFEIGPGLYVPPPALPEANLVAVQAPQLWELGFRGEGVLVGTIDSGVLITHPDLVNRIWNNPGEIAGNGLDDDNNGFIDDVHGWDFINGSNNVTSTDPHGTSTAGIAVGDGGGGKATGMAPGAKLLVCKVLSQASYWLAQQYCVQEGVDVLTSSYSYKWADAVQPDYHMFRQVADMELAAGVIHANSIGNQGLLQPTYPIPFNIATPGNCPSPFKHPQAAVGGQSSVLGCGGIQLPLDTIYSPSGRGPAAWDNITQYNPAYGYAQNSAYWDYPYGGFGGPGPGLIKPDLMAYATNVTAPSITTTYTIFSGTSAATPHLGGALALLRQVQPEALPRHLAAALELSAKDLGTAGKDTNFGSGRISAFDAGRRLRILGRVSDITPSIGNVFTLELFGYPSAQVYGWFGASIFDGPTAFNLASPFFGFGLLPLNPAGTASVPLALPNDPILVGLTVWFQFGAKNDDLAWGSGVLLSVPEPITIKP